MSDFLTRLAQRAVGQGPRVHPLVAPLYAPYRDAPLPPSDAADPVEEAVEVDARPALGRPRPAGPPSPSSVPPVAPRPARDAGPGPETAPASRRRPASVPRLAGEARPRASQAAERSDVPLGTEPGSRAFDRQTGRPAPPGGNPDRPIDGQRVNLDQQRPPPESAPHEAGIAAPPHPAANVAAAVDAGATREREREQAFDAAEDVANSQERPPAPAPNRPSPVAMPPAEDRSAKTPRRDEPAGAAPGPTVRVTIGRIEVRAETPPPARRPDRERRALSLDDYLRQRDGGAR